MEDPRLVAHQLSMITALILSIYGGYHHIDWLCISGAGVFLILFFGLLYIEDLL